MANEIEIEVKAEDKASATFDKTADSAEKAESRIGRLGETTDTLATKSGTAAGAFGALQSGIDLSRMGAIKHADALQGEADKLQEVADNVKDEAQAVIDAAKAKFQAEKDSADEQYKDTVKNIDARIKEAEKKAEADGKITDSEKKKLEALKESAEKQKDTAADNRDHLIEIADQESVHAQEAAQAQIKAAQDAADAKQKAADEAAEAANKESGLTQALMAGAFATDFFSGVTDFATLALTSSTIAKIKDAAASTLAATKTVIASAATKAWAIAQAGLNLVLSLNPIGLVIIAIAALIAIIIVIATKTDWFQKIWKVAWEGIKKAVEFTWNWIKDHWPLILSILTGPIGAAVIYIVRHWDTIVDTVKSLPGKIAKAASGMWDGIKNAFRSALNWVIDKWNGLNFSIPSFSAFGIKVGGFNLGVPHINRFASGGLGTGLALAGEGGKPELVQLGAGGRVFNGNQTARMLSSMDKLQIELMVTPMPGSDAQLMNKIVENLNFRWRTKNGIEWANV